MQAAENGRVARTGRVIVAFDVDERFPCEGQKRRRKGGAVNDNGSTTKTVRGGNGHTKIDPDRVRALFEDGYRDIEILEDGTIRERSFKNDATEELVTRSLKTGRTWYSIDGNTQHTARTGDVRSSNLL
jgi:hypothetical protein